QYLREEEEREMGRDRPERDHRGERGRWEVYQRAVADDRARADTVRPWREREEERGPPRVASVHRGRALAREVDRDDRTRGQALDRQGDRYGAQREIHPAHAPERARAQSAELGGL